MTFAVPGRVATNVPAAGAAAGKPIPDTSRSGWTAAVTLVPSPMARGTVQFDAKRTTKTWPTCRKSRRPAELNSTRNRCGPAGVPDGLGVELRRAAEAATDDAATRAVTERESVTAHPPSARPPTSVAAATLAAAREGPACLISITAFSPNWPSLS